jgi:putative nucleotidyltransferase with HDIG domain
MGPRSRQRLLTAIEAVETFPAHAHSRGLLIRRLDERAGADELVSAVESDVALTIRVLRSAERLRGAGEPLCGVPAAVAALPRSDLRRLAAATPTFGFHDTGGGWATVAEQFSLHALATVRAAELLIGEGYSQHPDVLRAGALLHDIGKLALLHSHGRYSTGADEPPGERLAEEHRACGLDHAVIGGVLARRLGLPERVAEIIEHHHSADADGETALVRVADILAHYSAGHRVDPEELGDAAKRVGIGGPALDAMRYELAIVMGAARPATPSPLSTRQSAALRLLAKGARYKQIGAELGITTNTVRSHVFNAYRKLGVQDRTQAVLVATQHGWI